MPNLRNIFVFDRNAKTFFFYAGLVELYTQADDAESLLNAVMLNKCISSHLWENSSFLTKQLPGIGRKGAAAFTNAGVHSFSKLLEIHPREIELV